MAWEPVWSVRPPFAAAPGPVRDWAAGVLGAPVAAALDVTGGFSSGVAARLTGTNGRRIFVKAVHADLNPFSPRMLRRELRLGPALAATGAAIPAVLGGLDRDGWVAVAFDDVDGASPPWPWSVADATAVLGAMAGLHDALTPADAVSVPDAAHALRAEVGAWAAMAAARHLPERIDPWVRAHFEELAAATLALDLRGDTVLNLDVRADNVVVDRDGRVWFVDWPWACRGPAGVDVTGLLVDFAVAGLDPQEWLGRAHVPDDDRITGMLCLLTSMWSAGLDRPDPPGTRGMRAFVRAHLDATVAWLRRRWG